MVNKENFGYTDRRCSIGFAFTEKHRGTGFPAKVVAHFQQYLFTKMDRLELVAEVDKKNARSIRFLEKMGYEEGDHLFGEDDGWVDPVKAKQGGKKYISPNFYYHLFRSKQARGRMVKYEKRGIKKYREQREKWVYLGDGKWKMP